MEGCKQFIRNIGEAPVMSLFATSTVVVLADMARTMFGEAKIDGAFVREMLADLVDLGMVESITASAKFSA